MADFVPKSLEKNLSRIKRNCLESFCCLSIHWIKLSEAFRGLLKYFVIKKMRIRSHLTVSIKKTL